MDEAKRLNSPTAEQMPHVVGADEWTDVQKGMMPAIGVTPHPDQEKYPGILVMADAKRDDGSLIVVCWHNKGCKRIGIKPEAVKFDKNGAPWCPTCFAENVNRDPKWNDPDEQVATMTPAPDTVNDTHRANRKALEEKRFREPGPLIGDDQIISDKEAEFQARPPERFEG